MSRHPKFTEPNVVVAFRVPKSQVLEVRFAVSKIVKRKLKAKK